MKLKCQPEDFRVQELPLVSPTGGGRYALYKLTKTNLGTLEAVDLISIMQAKARRFLARQSA